MSEAFGKVVKILDARRVVINRGELDQVGEGDRFLVYALGEEVTDPDTGESLGQIELIKGRAKAVHVQPHLTTIATFEVESTRRQVTRKTSRYSFDFMLGGGDTTTYFEDVREFEGVAVGDLVRPL